ncbi:PAS domain S-box protein [Granulicella sp. dw_53]|uniref:PAS domain S-box protein n=1 Tax=Granulicella sp. dw_53 TaxID=2719792 RepID=UPI001BD299A7|nr:PAS domain S-box protein [Granulicella sp. dw_53]
MTSRFQAYFFATGVGSAAIALSWISSAPSSCFLLAVVICSLYGGTECGIFSVVLSIVSFDYLFLSPQAPLTEHSSYPRVAAFIATAVSINLIIAAKQRGDRVRSEVEEQHRVITETSLDGVLSIGHQGEILLVNPSATEIFGCSGAEMIGKPIVRFVPRFRGDNAASVSEMTGLHRNGTEFVAEVTFGRVIGSSKSAAVIFVRDITERKRAENALRLSESYLAAAQRMSRTGSFGWHVSSGDIVWSAETFRIAGVDPNITPTLELIQERIHPEDRAAVRETMETSSRQGADLDFEHRFLLSDGSVKFVHVLGKAVHDEMGDLQYIGAAMDVTASKLAQESLQRFEEKLTQASQLATLSEASASIAHEINQPLTAIIANAHMCAESLSADSVDVANTRELVQEILDCSYHASEVVQRMRTLFKGGDFKKVPLDINDIAKEVRNLIRSEARKRKIGVEIDLEPELPEAWGDRVQIAQVLVNLCINGFDAMDLVMDGPRKLYVRTKVHDHVTIRVEVQDNGVGLHDPDRIFEAFYTTKANGMGMGLPICRSIIELHNGRLWPQRNEGSGTTFCFTIPALNSTMSAS